MTVCEFTSIEQLSSRNGLISLLELRGQGICPLAEKVSFGHKDTQKREHG